MHLEPTSSFVLRARAAVTAVVGWVSLVLIATIVSLPDLQRSVRSDPDLAVPLALARVDLAGDQGTAITGAHAWYIGYWATDVLDWTGLGTRPILVIPGLLWILTSLYVGSFWWRRGERVGAALATGLLLVLGRVMIRFVGAWDGRGGTAQLTVAAVLLIVLAQGRMEHRPRLAAALVFAAAMASSLATGSDSFGLFCTVAPLVVGVVALYRPDLRRTWRWLVGAAVLGLAAGYLETVAMVAISDLKDAGQSITLRTDLFAALGDLYRDGATLWSDELVFNEDVEGGNALLVLGFGAGWVLVAAVAVAAVAGVRSITADFHRSERWDGLPAGLAPWVGYWATSLLLQAMAFVFTSLSATPGFAGGRYLIVWWVAVAALMPLALRLRVGGLRWVALGAAACVVVVSGGRNVKDDVAKRDDPTGYYIDAIDLDAADVVQRTARKFGATHGYAGYFTAFSLGMGGDEVPVYPVMTCGIGRLPNFCTSGVGSRASMYRADEGRSFVILDTRQSPPPHAIAAPLAVPLRKLTTQFVAPGLAMVVYDGDLGAFVEPALGQTAQ